MKVNILTHQDNWILDKFAKEINDRLDYTTLNNKDLNNFDINYLNLCY
jgi:hypothetical protein